MSFKFTKKNLCAVTNKCPKCGTPLQYFTAKNNSDFLRCPKFPDCEFTNPATVSILALSAFINKYCKEKFIEIYNQAPIE